MKRVQCDGPGCDQFVPRSRNEFKGNDHRSFHSYECLCAGLRETLETELAPAPTWRPGHEEAPTTNPPQPTEEPPAPPELDCEEMAAILLGIPPDAAHLDENQKDLLEHALLSARKLGSLKGVRLHRARGDIQEAYLAIYETDAIIPVEVVVKPSTTVRSCCETLEGEGGYAQDAIQDGDRTRAGESLMLELWENTSAFFPEPQWIMYCTKRARHLNTLIWIPASDLMHEQKEGIFQSLQANMHSTQSFALGVSEKLRNIFASSPAVSAPGTAQFDPDQKYVWQLVDCLVTFTLQDTSGRLSLPHNEGWWGTNLHSHVIEKLFVYSKFDTLGTDAVRSSSKARYEFLQETLNRAKKPDMIVREAELLELLFVEHKGSSKDISCDRNKLLRLMKDALGLWSCWFDDLWHEDLRVFGVLTCGRQVQIYMMEYRLQEVAEASLLWKGDIPASLQRPGDLEQLLRLAAMMITIKEKMELLSNNPEGRVDKKKYKANLEAYHGNLQSAPTDGPPQHLHGEARKGNAKGPIDYHEFEGSSSEELADFPDWEAPAHSLTPGSPWAVTIGRQVSTGQSVAIKWLRSAARLNADAEREVLLHVMAMRANVPHVMPIIRALYPPKGSLRCLGLVMPCGEPLTIQRVTSMNLRQVKDVIRHISQALEGLHGLHMVHFDVSSRNIVIDQRGEATLIDFGHAMMLTPIFKPWAECGTLAYCAPEIVENRWTSVKSDLYSLGVVLLHLLIPHILPSRLSLLEHWNTTDRPDVVDTALNSARKTAGNSPKDLLRGLCQWAVLLTDQNPAKRPYHCPPAPALKRVRTAAPLPSLRATSQNRQQGKLNRS